MTLPVRVHAATHVGLVHHRNEDAWTVSPTEEGALLLLVCDGMGGMGRGDEASQLAVAAINDEMRSSRGLPPERMRHAIRVADDKVREVLCSGQQGHPGSTAVMAYVTDGAAHVAWVGDSRAYLIRDHRVVDRTRDHKLVEELVAAGQLTPDEAKASSLAHVVTRALGGRGPDEPAVEAANLSHPWRLVHGDVVLLCSDGLCDLVDDDELPTLVDGLAPDRATEVLIETALARGGHDNITCIFARWEGATYHEDDVATPVMRDGRTQSDVRGWSTESLEAGLERSEDGRVTEEIGLDEMADLIRGREEATDEISSPDLVPAPLPEITGPLAGPKAAPEVLPGPVHPGVYAAVVIGGLLGALAAWVWVSNH